MALKPTIYKFNISLSDTNRNYYDSLNLTVAQHPSESLERMMARVMAFCLNADESLSFTKGLSEPDVPDIWARTLDGQLDSWIDVGEPGLERIKKASRLAKKVSIYSFNSKSSVWWQQNNRKFSQLPVSVFRFEWDDMLILAGFVERSMSLSVTISGDSAYVATAGGECNLEWVRLEPL